MFFASSVPMTGTTDASGDASETGGWDSWVVRLSNTSSTADNGYAVETLTVALERNGKSVDDLTPIAQQASQGTSTAQGGHTYSSESGSNVGSWGFDEDGYGPFGSFYAAFDPSHDNRLICHLDPNNLGQTLEKETSIEVDGEYVNISDCNIMWCLPTVYWGTDSDGTLVMSNQEVDGIEMKAYAHTVGGTVYPFIGIGVYEAGLKTTGSGDLMTSNTTASKKSYFSTWESVAKAQKVDTAGTGENGQANVWTFYQYELYKYCILAAMGSWDSQGVAGCGYTIQESGSYANGDLSAKGPYAGTICSENPQNFNKL